MIAPTAPRARTLAGTPRTAVAAVAIAFLLSAAPGCGPAVRHPAITAGVVAGAMGFATCKLASDNYAACGLVAGGAGAFLGLVTAVALWLGGDGNSTGLDDPPQALPEDNVPPLKLGPLPTDEPATAAPPAPKAPPPSGPPPSAPPPQPSPSPTAPPPQPSPSPTAPPPSA